MSSESASRAVFNEWGVQSLLKLPSSVQKQVLKKAAGIIAAAPQSAGYPLQGELAGFRGIHTNRYRVVWRLQTLASGEVMAEISYVGIRAEGDRRDAYTEFQKLLANMNQP